MSEGRLAGQSVIVTGGAQGIGQSIVEVLAREGASITIGDIQLEKAMGVAENLRTEGLSASAVKVDITRPNECEAMVASAIKEFGKVDALVNDAAIDAPRGMAWEIDEAHWRKIIDTDLSGAWWCTKAVLSHMIERRAGRIVFMSSIAGRQGSIYESVAYNTAKAGLIGLTIGLATHVERFGILVNAIAPGPTGTGEPMTSVEINADKTTYPIPISGPKPIADACLYLLADSGAWISGALLNVSGGRWHGP